jgi:hypothetical protein
VKKTEEPQLPRCCTNIQSPSKETHVAAVSYPQEATEKKEEELTVAMMKALPQLLRKYQADKAKVMDLVEVTAYLKLELYSLKRQEPVRKGSSSSSTHVGALSQEGRNGVALRLKVIEMSQVLSVEKQEVPREPFCEPFGNTYMFLEDWMFSATHAWPLKNEKSKSNQYKSSRATFSRIQSIISRIVSDLLLKTFRFLSCCRS